MGFDSRHADEVLLREDLAAVLARDHGLELARSRELLQRAEHEAAWDPQVPSVRHWFAILVEGDARRGPAVGKRTLVDGDKPGRRHATPRAVNNVHVPSSVDGWCSVAFRAGQLIWIPSRRFTHSMIGRVSSGSHTYEAADALGIAGAIERAGELMSDFATVIQLARGPGCGLHAVHGVPISSGLCSMCCVRSLE